MASDGLWDVMTSQQAVNFVRKKLRETKSGKETAVSRFVYIIVAYTKHVYKIKTKKKIPNVLLLVQTSLLQPVSSIQS
jgi:hypothetical protein